jgi:hypothetical protein
MKLKSLKSVLPLIIVFIIINGSCKSKAESDAVQQAKDIQKMVKENSPGTIATTADGYTMIATVDGKEWKATAMYPPDVAGQVVGENNGESISLPYYDRKNFLQMKIDKRKLGDGGSAVDMRLNDKIALYSAVKGEMEVTKVDEKSAEGKFFFTAKGFQSDKTIEVTNGFFRILFK